MTLAGEKKCMPSMRSGLSTTLASSLMFKYDVLLARIVSGRTVLLNVLKTSFLTSMFSKTASITKSTSESSL